MTAFFPEGTGGVTGHNTHGNSGMVGEGFVQKLEIAGRRGCLHKIPSVVGVRIVSGTTHCMKPCNVSAFLNCLIVGKKTK